MYSPDKACLIIVACSILHNICRRENIPLPDDDEPAPRYLHALPEQPAAPEEQQTEYRRGWDIREQLAAFLAGN